MQLVNHTPFPVLAFRGIDTRDREYHVVVMRVTYRLQPDALIPGQFTPILLEDDPPGLEMEDRYRGDVGSSSLLCESDLAPFKPRCDVILTGVAHAPRGQMARQWRVGLRLGAERSAKHGGLSQREIVLDKHLTVNGPRSFRRYLREGWLIGQSEAARQVPLCYELSYGGKSVVPQPRRQDREDDAGALEFLLNEVCFLNPLGRGWQQAEYEAALREAGLEIPDERPAPQIEPEGVPVETVDVVAQPRGPLNVQQMVLVAQQYRYRPAGFGALGRVWTPRIQKAGTYDEVWLKERWPNLPPDFDMGYWNGAPEDQQIAFPPSDFWIELENLIDPSLAPNGLLSCRLPGHRAAFLFRLHSGLLIAVEPVIDTVHIDAEIPMVALVWRAAITTEMNVAVAEARFEPDPSLELFRMVPRTST